MTTVSNQVMQPRRKGAGQQRKHEHAAGSESFREQVRWPFRDRTDV